MSPLAGTTAALALMLGVATGPAWASCADDIATLEKQVDAKAHQSVAANTGGQADAAARGGKAEATKKAGMPVTTLPAPDGTEATEATAKAAEGSDSAIKAKVILNDAKTALGRGDEAKCREAITRVRDALKG